MTIGQSELTDFKPRPRPLPLPHLFDRMIWRMFSQYQGTPYKELQYQGGHWANQCLCNVCQHMFVYGLSFLNAEFLKFN